MLDGLVILSLSPFSSIYTILFLCFCLLHFSLFVYENKHRLSLTERNHDNGCSIHPHFFVCKIMHHHFFTFEGFILNVHSRSPNKPKVGRKKKAKFCRVAKVKSKLLNNKAHSVTTLRNKNNILSKFDNFFNINYSTVVSTRSRNRQLGSNHTCFFKEKM